MKIFSLVFIALSCTNVDSLQPNTAITAPPKIDVVERTASPATIGLYWKDDHGKAFGNFAALFEANKGPSVGLQCRDV